MDSICLRPIGPETMSTKKCNRQTSTNEGAAVKLPLPLVFGATLILALVLLGPVQANKRPSVTKGAAAGSQAPKPTFEQYLAELRTQDQCRAVFTAKKHGYDVIEYKVTTNDKYQLCLHRLIHPEDYLAGAGAPRRRRKPYLLVHGLIGTSAGWLTNMDEHYRAPPRTYDARAEFDAQMKAFEQLYQYEWVSTAERLRQDSVHEQRKDWVDHSRKYAASLELQFDGPHMEFGRQYRQAYKKFNLPRDSIGYTTNSLATTLANFGYDVWLANLRGNRYSRSFDGSKNAESAEYWDFNIETIFKEDLVKTIRFIEQKTKLESNEHIGLVAYSYSAAYAMGLLTKFPYYQQMLRPIMLVAPTLLTGTDERGMFKFLMKGLNALISKNGPFPVFSRTSLAASKSSALSLNHLDEKLKRLVCQMPVASELCRLLEIIIHGKQVSSIKGLLSTDRSSALMRRDIDCGQTSKAILHEIIKNISSKSINPKFEPFAPAKQSRMHASGSAPPARSSIMLIHSEADSISTPEEVAKIRNTALKTLTLVDYLIRAPNFQHPDFLFSTRNQYLVNAEMVRMALVHDYLTEIWDRPRLSSQSAEGQRLPPRPELRASPPPNAQQRQASELAVSD